LIKSLFLQHACHRYSRAPKKLKDTSCDLFQEFTGFSPCVCHVRRRWWWGWSSNPAGCLCNWWLLAGEWRLAFGDILEPPGLPADEMQLSFLKFIFFTHTQTGV